MLRLAWSALLLALPGVWSFKHAGVEVALMQTRNMKQLVCVSRWQIVAL